MLGGCPLCQIPQPATTGFYLTQSGTGVEDHSHAAVKSRRSLHSALMQPEIGYEAGPRCRLRCQPRNRSRHFEATDDTSRLCFARLNRERLNRERLSRDIARTVRLFRAPAPSAGSHLSAFAGDRPHVRCKLTWRWSVSLSNDPLRSSLDLTIRQRVCMPRTYLVLLLILSVCEASRAR